MALFVAAKKVKRLVSVLFVTLYYVRRGIYGRDEKSTLLHFCEVNAKFLHTPVHILLLLLTRELDFCMNVNGIEISDRFQLSL